MAVRAATRPARAAPRSRHGRRSRAAGAAGRRRRPRAAGACSRRSSKCSRRSRSSAPRVLSRRSRSRPRRAWWPRPGERGRGTGDEEAGSSDHGGTVGSGARPAGTLPCASRRTGTPVGICLLEHSEALDPVVEAGVAVRTRVAQNAKARISRDRDSPLPVQSGRRCSKSRLPPTSPRPRTSPHPRRDSRTGAADAAHDR